MKLFIASALEFARSVAGQVRYLGRPHEVLLRQHIILTDASEEPACLEYLLGGGLLVGAWLAALSVPIVVEIELSIFFSAILLVRLLLARENLFVCRIYSVYVIIVVVAKRWRSLQVE